MQNATVVVAFCQSDNMRAKEQEGGTAPPNPRRRKVADALT
jgi:hypothetical protein